MTINEKIEGKERLIKDMLERLRNTLNNKRIEFNKKPNDWNYLTSLSITEQKLQELLEGLN
jgi:hypothetical protein